MRGIKEILEQIDMDPSCMDVNRDGYALITSLLDIAESDTEPEVCIKAVNTIERISNVNKTAKIASMVSQRLVSVAASAYSARNFQKAEILFRFLAENGDAYAKKCYAFMIRRHEIDKVTSHDHVLALRLLQDGVNEGDSFSLVNVALVFALMLGDDESWHMADSVFERLSGVGSASISSWWEDSAKNGDIEGFLVVFFLLRHGKIKQSELGSIKSIAWLLTNGIESFPEWLSKEYSYNTIDEVIEDINDQDFDLILEDFLDKMPCSRENVEKMLKVVSVYDLWLVYYKLLTSCKSLLRPEERDRLESDYQNKDLERPASTEKFLFITDRLQPFTKDKDEAYWLQAGFSALESRVYAKLGEMYEGDDQEQEAYRRFQPMLGNENYSIETLCEAVESNIKYFYKARAEGQNPFSDPFDEEWDD